MPGDVVEGTFTTFGAGLQKYLKHAVGVLSENDSYVLSEAGVPLANEVLYILESTMGNETIDPRIGDGRMWFCCMCGLEYRAKDLVLWRGNYYCKPLRHTRIITSILQKEAADRYTPHEPNEQVAGPIIVENVDGVE